jgi:hypothetical protein
VKESRLKRLNRPAAVRSEVLACLQPTCPLCGGPTWRQSTNRRQVITLEGVVELRLRIQQCRTPTCTRYHKPYRPEAEGRYSLPQHEFGLDVIAEVGRLRRQEHTSVPEIHQRLQVRLAPLLTAVKEALDVPIVGVILDGQQSVRNAIAQALPDVPHQLCQFHYLKEAATPVYEADRHAKKELKKRVRGVRPIERAVAEQDGPAATLVSGYAVAIRSALSDDGTALLDAPGLRLQERLSQIQSSMQAMGQKGDRSRC